MRTSLMLALAALSSSPLALAAPALALTETWSLTGSPEAIAVGTSSPVLQAIDQDGHLYIATNAAYADGTTTIAIDKRDADGELLWSAEHDLVGEHELVTEIVVDGAGDLWILAQARTRDPANNTITHHGVALTKLAGDSGAVLLDTLDAEPDRLVHMPTAIAIDAAGRVVVASWHLTVNTPLVGKVRVLDLDGVEQWARTSTAYRPLRLAPSANGEIYAAGQRTSQVDYAIARYSAQGAELWLKTADNAGQSDYLDRVVADAAGDVIATGLSGTQSFTIKLRRQNGKLLWKRLLASGPLVFSASEEAGLRLHPSGDVIIASGYQQVTVSRLAGGNGAVRWSVAPAIGGFAALTTDPSGDVLIATASGGAHVSHILSANGALASSAHAPLVDEYTAIGVDPQTGVAFTSGYTRTEQGLLVAITAAYE